MHSILTNAESGVMVNIDISQKTNHHHTKFLNKDKKQTFFYVFIVLGFDSNLLLERSTHTFAMDFIKKEIDEMQSNNNFLALNSIKAEVEQIEIKREFVIIFLILFFFSFPIYYIHYAVCRIFS